MANKYKNLKTEMKNAYKIVKKFKKDESKLLKTISSYIEELQSGYDWSNSYTQEGQDNYQRKYDEEFRQKNKSSLLIINTLCRLDGAKINLLNDVDDSKYAYCDNVTRLDEERDRLITELVYGYELNKEKYSPKMRKEISTQINKLSENSGYDEIENFIKTNEEIKNLIEEYGLNKKTINYIIIDRKRQVLAQMRTTARALIHKYRGIRTEREANVPEEVNEKISKLEKEKSDLRNNIKDLEVQNSNDNIPAKNKKENEETIKRLNEDRKAVKKELQEYKKTRDFFFDKEKPLYEINMFKPKKSNHEGKDYIVSNNRLFRFDGLKLKHNMIGNKVIKEIFYEKEKNGETRREDCGKMSFYTGDASANKDISVELKFPEEGFIKVAGKEIPIKKGSVLKLEDSGLEVNIKIEKGKDITEYRLCNGKLITKGEEHLPQNKPRITQNGTNIAAPYSRNSPQNPLINSSTNTNLNTGLNWQTNQRQG